VHSEPRVLQAVTPVQPSAGNQNCSAAYQAVFTSTLPNGACHSAHCGIACQTLISDMLHKCQGQTFTQTVDGTDITYSFSQQAADALRMLGPQDCTYEDASASANGTAAPSPPPTKTSSKRMLTSKSAGSDSWAWRRSAPAAATSS
jgi:hypothetical protein